MPIKPENKSKYPLDWKQIRERVFRRAGGRCERCGVPQYAVGYRDGEGRFNPLAGNGPCDAAGQGKSWPNFQPLTYREAQEFAEVQNCCGDGKRQYDDDGNHWFVVVLTVAHLNHSLESHDEAGLALLCQRCHNRHDTQHRAGNAAETRRNKRARWQTVLEVS